MEDRKKIRLDRCILAKSRGYVYCENTGLVITHLGNVSKRKTNGYIFFSVRDGKKRFNLNVHIYGWFYKYNEVVDYLDHKNCIRSDNRIQNLRSVTNQQNRFNNSIAKGYCFDKSRNKWLATIKLNGIQKNLGRFNSEIEAREAYLKAKKIYHIL